MQSACITHTWIIAHIDAIGLYALIAYLTALDSIDALIPYLIARLYALIDAIGL